MQVARFKYAKLPYNIRLTILLPVTSTNVKQLFMRLYTHFMNQTIDYGLFHRTDLVVLSLLVCVSYDKQQRITIYT